VDILRGTDLLSGMIGPVLNAPCPEKLGSQLQSLQGNPQCAPFLAEGVVAGQ